MKRIFFSIVILAVLILIGWQVIRQVNSAGSGGPARRGPIPTAVEIQQPSRQTIRDVGEFTGSLLPASKFIVAPKTNGRLQKIYVNIGDEVRSAALIAELDNDEYQQQLEQANAELAVARANLEESRIALDITARDLERVKSLRATKIASESELDAAQAQFHAQEARSKVALAQLDQKKALLKSAEVRLAYTRVTVPVKSNNEKWVVGERFVDEGALLAVNSPIVSILDISRLIAVVYVIERDYPKMRPGQPAVITTDAFPGRTFHGRIVRLAPELREASRQARIDVEIANEDLALKPGMFVRVQIEYGSRSDVLTIPVGALVNRNEVLGVFQAELESRTARFVPVKLGIVSGNLAEIVEPALTGHIVTLGQHLLTENAPILLPSNEKGALSSSSPGRRPERP